MAETAYGSSGPDASPERMRWTPAKAGTIDQRDDNSRGKVQNVRGDSSDGSHNRSFPKVQPIDEVTGALEQRFGRRADSSWEMPNVS
jgi:hypothetical protein